MEENKDKKKDAKQPENQSNAPAVVAVVVLLVAAVFLVWFLMSDMDEELNDDNDEDTTEETTDAEEEFEPTIAELVSDDPNFSTLNTALETADEADGVDLVETLNGDEPYTVFAPTNDAFDALPEGELDALLNDPEALADVLMYHVADGEVTSEQIVEVNQVDTLQGGVLSVAVSDEGEAILNDSVNVTDLDVFASNGVIHVVDGVLLP